MKKRIVAVLIASALTGGLLTGCSGQISNDYVTVKKYKGLEVPQVEAQEVTDDQVEQMIQSNLTTVEEITDPMRKLSTQGRDRAKWTNTATAPAVPATPRVDSTTD